MACILRPLGVECRVDGATRCDSSSLPVYDLLWSFLLSPSHLITPKKDLPARGELSLRTDVELQRGRPKTYRDSVTSFAIGKSPQSQPNNNSIAEPNFLKPTIPPRPKQYYSSLGTESPMGTSKRDQLRMRSR